MNERMRRGGERREPSFGGARQEARDDDMRLTADARPTRGNRPQKPRREEPKRERRSGRRKRRGRGGIASDGNGIWE